jgi:hypothetical protein
MKINLDVQAEDGQIWLIDPHEIRRRRHLSATFSPNTQKYIIKIITNQFYFFRKRNQRIFGLARNCGQHCAFKLRHENVQTGELQQFEVHFKRKRFNSFKRLILLYFIFD